MKKTTKIHLKRLPGYLLGVVLFYAPFALFVRLMHLLLGVHQDATVHRICMAMNIQSILTGNFSRLAFDLRTICLVLLTLCAIFFGPLFCGRLCPTGALAEYLSRLVPEKFQLKIGKKINPTPVRYGLFLGFVISPLLNIGICCPTCGFGSMQAFLSAPFDGFPVRYSASFITMFLWLVVGGLFTKGGRGWCNFLCPVGAFQGLLHGLCSRLPFTFKRKLDRSKCVSCGACVDICPMGSLNLSERTLQHNAFNCIQCGACQQVCPKKAITYGTGDSGWKQITVQKNEIHSASSEEA